MLKIRKKISQKAQKKSAGFTLTELLVSIILGSAIVAGLMSLVVELLTTDARETARTETQREMQMALDYISRDVREAVYVYDGGCLAGVNATGQTGQVKSLGTQCAGISKALAGEDAVPILAFWKLEDLPNSVGCGNGGTAGVACLSGRMYTLVAYLLVDNKPGDTWKGLARIERYELPRFQNNGTNGYASQFDPNGVEFVNWPGAGNGSPNYGNGNRAVLVDFVDDRSLTDPELVEALGGKAQSVECPDEYVLTPDKSALTGNLAGVRNFYACVKVPENLKPSVVTSGASAGAFNQKVILFLRGNASGKPGIKTANEGYMPAISTQVLNRGVKDKVPQ